MIGMSPIERLIQLSLWSAYVYGDKPQSLLILSEVEGGKSAVAMQFAQTNGSVVILQDATAHGIIKEYGQNIVEGKIKHFIFPEFIFPLSRQKETVNTFLAFLNGLLEEGIYEIETYATQIHFDKPLQAGAIACLAKDEFEWRKYYWSSIGFLSRFLPVSYSYSEQLQKIVLETIFEQRKAEVSQQFTFTPGIVELSADIARAVNPFAKLTTESMSTKRQRSGGGPSEIKKLAGFRMQKHYQRLLKAAALSHGRTRVEKADLEEVVRLSAWINLDYHPL